MSKQFTKTQDLIRSLIPGNDNKAIRHELYTLIHSFHVNKVAPGVTIQNFQYSHPINTAVLDRIAQSLNEERYGCSNLSSLVFTVLKTKTENKEAFTYHDITDTIRNMVNNSRLELLDDRPFVDVEIQPGVVGLSQEIPHEEVRGIVQTLETQRPELFDGYVRQYNPQNRCNVFTPQTVAPAPNSLQARLWGAVK